MTLSSRSEDSGFVSRETTHRLEIYADLVRKWQKSINLVSASTLGDLWERHINDSLQITRLAGAPQRWIDMGSGAGFPGLVTGICMAGGSEGWVHLVESNNKKAAFLRQVIRDTGARASVHPVRIEDVGADVGEIDAISARALASLPELLRMAQPFAERNPMLQCWFHKGLEYGEEVRSAGDRWSFDLVEHPSVVQEGSVILQLTHIKPR
ncbi:16S rRNA (guanine527-N7)-methyltransferase [Hoeflea marina]|uniref:Ribosomal RNA small subunit methyltransferase G n=1 Tax=Hoeflea marina TaxID=274592 RepID=A0A317PLR1_9HYPH|nr:16S rRNA (guanine(527)-N(7))-methyltransferase RsmG [Hoeflea marina]PWW00555.1 16S rRNA (guanine527-N7)-methyltransferase [Hoeflea marina]